MEGDQSDATCKEPDTEGHVAHDSLCRKHPEQANRGDRQQSGSCWGWGRGVGGLTANGRGVLWGVMQKFWD